MNPGFADTANEHSMADSLVGQTITIPMSTTGSGFSLLRVVTYRGVYTLKCADID